MGWSSILDAEVDAESPVTSTLWTKYRDNAEYNYYHALRGGTNAVGQRLVVARGVIPISGTGVSVAISEAVVFATDAEDGDPDFGAAPVVTYTIYANQTDGNSWWRYDTRIKRLYIQSGSLSASGFTLEGELTSNNAAWDLAGEIHWLAVGEPNVEAGFVAIAGTDTDQDSPTDEDVTMTLRDNANYNHDHALRCGTHKSGVRLAIARGKSAVADLAGDGALDFVPIDFSTEALDGDPNFSAPPVVLLGLEEDTSGDGDDWITKDINITRFYLNYTIGGFEPDPDGPADYAVSRYEAMYTLTLYTGVNADNFDGYVHWIAIGPVTAGE